MEVRAGSLGASKLKVVGAAAAGGGAPKENEGASPLNLLASFFSSSSSSPQFVAFVSKSDMAGRAASARRLPRLYASASTLAVCASSRSSSDVINDACRVAQGCIAHKDAARGEKIVSKKASVV